jgi:3-isopropylmalate/(R)-2-methylmalate dehydratase small subunit
MTESGFSQIVSHSVYLPVDDIDTDQIIPARYLKATDKAGMGEALFADWRARPDFVLNRAESQGAQILFAGRNFGCGSSREHAPWALSGFGFRAVVARSFGDIFRNNALKNSLLPVELDEAAHRMLSDELAANPDLLVTVDLASQTVKLGDRVVGIFPIDSFSKTCLLKGVDELGYLLSFEEQISEYESYHGAV